MITITAIIIGMMYNLQINNAWILILADIILALITLEIVKVVVG